MSNKIRYLTAFIAAILFTACQKQEDSYPDIITEMADVSTDTQGNLAVMITDGQDKLHILNPKKTPYPNTVFRLLCGYVKEQQGARLYTTEAVHVLKDSSIVLQEKEPLNIISVWKSSRYLNFHLSYPYHNQVHRFCYSTDSIVGETTYLQLHQLYTDDQQSYTGHAYASIPLSAIKTPSIKINLKYDFKR